MDLWERVLSAVLFQYFNCLMTATMIVFLHCFYDTDFQWARKNVLYSIGYFLIGFTMCVLFGFRIVNLVILGIARFFVAVCNYKGNKIKGIVGFLLAYTSVGICTYCIGFNSASILLPGISMKAILVNGISGIPYAVWMFISIEFIVFFGLIFCYLYLALYRRGVFVQCGSWEFALATIYPILCLAVSRILYSYEKTSTVTIYLLSSFSVLIALLFPLFLYYIRINRHYQKLTEALDYYMQTELAHFMQYKQAQEETVRFRHDIRNNLLCVSGMIQSGKTDEAQGYLQDLLQATDSLCKKYVSGDEMLDCIIGVKAGVMEEKGIHFQLEGVLAGGLQWKAMDICIVFANALDNAIAACEQLASTERSITMTIRSTAQFWLVTIENPIKDHIDINLLFRKYSGYTSKADRQQHGIGTYNIKRTVEKHGGVLKATCRDSLFALEIIIDKSQMQPNFIH